MEKKKPDKKPFPLTAVLGLALAGSLAYVGYLRAELARLEGRLDALEKSGSAARSRPVSPAPSPAKSEAQALSSVDTNAPNLTAEQRAAMVERLRQEQSADRAVWFAVAANDRTGSSFHRELSGIFQESGWKIRGTMPIDFPMKRGIWVFMADESPPSYVDTALAAFDAAGITVTAGRDYRAFHAEKKKENPNWKGFDLAPDQSYLIVLSGGRN